MITIKSGDWRRMEKESERYMQEIRDIVSARLSRRELLKLGLVMGGAGLLGLSGVKPFKPYWAHAGRKVVCFPPTLEFVEPLPIPPAMTPVTLNPQPTMGVNLALSSVNGFREAIRNPHQRWTEFGGTSTTTPGFTGKMYQSRALEIPDYAIGVRDDGTPLRTHIWAYQDLATGSIGPLRINARYGEPVIHRVHNDLPRSGPFAGGFGINEISTHLHNGHHASESDGSPVEMYGPGRFKDHHYPNVRAGFASNYPTTTLNGRTVQGDYRETMSFLWFHDHRHDFTAQNVYKGLASFYPLFSDDINLDTGDETTGLRLPSGEFDIPLIFQDLAFSSDGELFFDHFDLDGMLGCKEAVNFKIKPFLEVKRRRYRFRLLGAGPSRFRDLSLSNGQNFLMITNDGNLLPRVLPIQVIRVSVANRYDVIVDFSNAQIGDKIYLQNTLKQTNGAGPSGRSLRTPDRMLEFRVVGDAVDNSLPYQGGEPLLELPAMHLVQTFREFHFGTGWDINGELFNPAVISFFVPQDASEQWTLSSGGGWAHPVHMHNEEIQILSRDGNGPPPWEVARKDMADIGGNVVGSTSTSRLDFYTQHRDWRGHYPLHCHNTVHEDHAMMLRFNVGEPVPETGPDIDPIL